MVAFQKRQVQQRVDASHAMKERSLAAALATRFLSSPTRRTARMETLSGRNASADSNIAAGPSKLIAALDALGLNSEGDDSEVEIVAVGPAPIKPKGATTTGRKKVNASERTHPLFLSAVNSRRPDGSDKTSKSTVGDLKLHSSTRRNATSPPCPNDVGTPANVEQPITMNDVRSVPDTNATATANSEIHKDRTKELGTSALPPYSHKDYHPRTAVVYTRHEEEANDLVESLKSGPIGFDMEWRVFWTRRPGSASSVPQARRVAVVQLADTAGVILVIQVGATPRFPKKLQELIENPNIPKLGANIANDGTKLLNDYGILAKNLLELGALVHLADPVGGNVLAGTRSLKWKNIISLEKLVEHYCKKSLSKPKTIRMGNWEAELDDLQIDYAASDAHCAVKIYKRLLELADENGINLPDDTIQERCCSSISTPTSRTTSQELSRAPSCSDVSMADGASKSGQLLRHETMPNLTSTTKYGNGSTPGMRPQQLRAYQFWHERGMSLEKMCIELSLKSKGYGGTGFQRGPNVPEHSMNGGFLSEGDEQEKRVVAIDSGALKPSTVISYVVGALQCSSKLPFDMGKLRELVQMDGSSWERHRDWLLQAWSDGRGVMY